MANFYIDTPALRLNLKNDLMKRIVELKERNYTDRGKYDYAPIDFADAIDSYDKVLEIAGEICGDIIAPNAESVAKPRCNASGRPYGCYPAACLRRA